MPRQSLGMPCGRGSVTLRVWPSAEPEQRQSRSPLAVPGSTWDREHPRTKRCRPLFLHLGDDLSRAAAITRGRVLVVSEYD